MKAHSEIGASSMSRWSVCPASVRLSRGMPNTSSSYAEEGTKAHDLAERILKLKNYSCEDESMLDAVHVYTGYVMNLWGGCSCYGIEEQFDLSPIYPGLYGTCDSWVYHSSTSTLHVIDYKHGQGIAVEAENNKQLRYYALGALLKLKLPVSKVTMTIVQPRAWHPDGAIRSWTIPVSDLLDFTADLVEAAEATQKDDSPIVSGDHCRFCPAAAICPGLHETALETAKLEFSPALKYEPAKLAEALNKLEAVKAWTKSIEEFAFNEANRGIEIPGYQLVEKRASRKWKDDEKLEHKMLLELGLSYVDLYESKLKSPAEVEKLLSKEDKDLLAQFVTKESSGKKLAPITSKAKKAKTAIETDFTKITN